MKYSPIKICAYFVLTLLVLFGIMHLSVSKNLDTGKSQEGFFIGNVTVKYPTVSSFLEQTTIDKASLKNMDSIVANVEELVIEVEEVNEEGPIKNEKFVPKIPDLTQIDTSKVQRIDYPADRAAFLSQLKSNLNNVNCRIIHYGDSQLEGDRISAYLRNRLQNIYGGSGPGFAPIVQVYENISSVVSHSDNWTRYAYFDPTQEKFPHKKYGAYTSLSRFTPFYNTPIDSLLLDSLQVTKATIGIGIPTKSYGLLKKFHKVGLHYGNALAPTTIKVYKDGVLIKSEHLISDGNYHKCAIDLATTPSHLQIVLESKISPDFYGLTLDGANGISLDNVAMRGSSGTVFAGSNGDAFAQMYRQLDPKLIIFQYGGNSVPYLKDSIKVNQYVNYLKNHLRWVKQKTTNANIIFIGPSDMTTTDKGVLKTYPLLPYLNETLKKTCLENDIAYWSMFDAMGGENSMEHWVNQKLAATDYTHFSPSGTKVISELFFLTLYLDLTDIQ
ncbi:MAG TPA: hypothetical protein VKZ98_09065 [Aquaticitalea sp.]|nr:hypothetical protein [Aquaticitalea sp.]